MSNNIITDKTNLRLTAFHMAREILNEQRHFGAQIGDKVDAPTVEEIEQTAEKIISFITK